MTRPPFSPDTLDFLTSPAGEAILARLAGADLRDANTLPLLEAMRRDLPAEQAAAALTLARLRQRAAKKFSRAHAMIFTADALEQATAEPVSAWRARRLAGAPTIADLGCGIGGDTLALAALPGASVFAIDADFLRLRMARVNLGVYDRHAHFVQADLRDPLPLGGVEVAFFDPARRTDRGRVFSVSQYIPPLEVIADWPFAALAAKLSPGVHLDELTPYTAQGAGIEFVSMAGELKEAVLWCGAMGFAGRRAAIVMPDGTGMTLEPAGYPPPPLSEPRAYLYEPDPALIRAGLFGELAAHLGMALYRLDETIAYLTADEHISTPWARVWTVRAWLPFHLKRLREALRARGIGRVTVKKRGSPLTPEGLTRKLKLDGSGDEGVVVLTRLRGQHVALICDPPHPA